MEKRTEKRYSQLFWNLVRMGKRTEKIWDLVRFLFGKTDFVFIFFPLQSNFVSIFNLFRFYLI